MARTDASTGDVVVHLDLHPGNVILTGSTVPPSWTGATPASARPSLDVALTALIIAEVAVDAGGIYAQAARALLAAFLAAVDVDIIGALDGAAVPCAQDPGLACRERALWCPSAAALVRDLIEVIANP